MTELIPMQTEQQRSYSPDMQEYWQLQVESAQRKLNYAVMQLARFAVRTTTDTEE